MVYKLQYIRLLLYATNWILTRYVIMIKTTTTAEICRAIARKKKGQKTNLILVKALLTGIEPALIFRSL